MKLRKMLMRVFNIKEDKPIKTYYSYQFFEYDEDIVAIEILEGPFKGLRYFYDQVSPRESLEGLVLDFNFTIISFKGPNGEEGVDADNPDLRKTMGDILIEILMKEA